MKQKDKHKIWLENYYKLYICCTLDIGCALEIETQFKVVYFAVHIFIIYCANSLKADHDCLRQTRFITKATLKS